MRLLNNVDLIWDARGFIVLFHHLSSEIDDIDIMKAPTARAAILEECGGGNGSVEQLRVLEIFEPCLVDDNGDEELDSALG